MSGPVKRPHGGGGLRRRRLLQLGGLLAAAAAAVVVLVLVGGSSGDEGGGGASDGGVTGAAQTTRLFAGVPQDGTVLGDPDARVTLIEYADLQCPFCAQFAVETVPELVDRYVRPGRVKLELRLLRFLGEDSDRAARAAVVAAEQGRFWPFVELLFRNQGEENSGWATDSFITSIGAAVPGLDEAALVSRAGEAGVERRLARFERQAGDAGVSSTPSFSVGGPGSAAPEPIELESLDVSAFTGPLDAALARRR